MSAHRSPPPWSALCSRAARMLFVATLLLGLCASARAVSVEAIDVAQAPPHVELAPRLSLLEDRGAQLDASAALADPGWQAATPALLNRGFTRSAFWLRGTLTNSGSRPVTRWLSLGVVRLEDVRYYRLPPGSTMPDETIAAGNRVPLDSRPVRAALSVFPVTLAPAERVDFVLRVASRSAVSIDVNLWTPAAFREDEERSAMAEMILAGSMLTIALYALILGIARRDRVFLLLAGAVITDVVYDLAFRGYLYRYVLTAGGEFILRAPSVIPSITTALFSAMALSFAGLDRVPLWKWTYRVLIGVCGLMSLWTAFGDYRISAQIAVSIVFVCNIVWLVSMLDGWRRGYPNARVFLVAFAVDCTTLFVRLAFIHGLIHDRWGIGTGIAWDNLSVLLMLVIIVAGRSRQMEQEQRRTQQTLLDERARVQQSLERAVDERTRELQSALIAADEASNAKTDFLARISHDLRTPLTSIIGFADLVQAGGHEDAERGGIIRRSAAHMLAMVNDLIDYAAGTDANTLNQTPVYTHALLNAIAHESASLARRQRNRFVLDIRDELPPIVELDEKRLRQVLGNLIDNAFKFTSDGTVTLSASCERAAANDTVTFRFAVADTGCGIAADDQQRIFEPFLRLDSARGQPGIGLGLAIVKHWIAQMNGALGIESAPGAGTTISVALPTRIVDEAQLAQHYVSDAFGVLPELDGAGKRIWIAEDTEEIRRFLAEELSNIGFDVEASPDGDTMIRRIVQAADAPPDLVITDHLMPGQDGTAVLAAVRRYWPGVPVVAISATPQAVRDAANPEQRGYDACLLKPVNLAELRNTLARWIGLASSAAAGHDATQLPSARPTAPALAEAQRLIELGAMSDLVDWADSLTAREPECTPFALELRHLARRGDLLALQSLCQS